MYPHYLICVIFCVFNLGYVSPTTPSRAKLFSNAFIKVVQNSSRLIEIFDISAPASDLSVIIYHSGLFALKTANIEKAESLAKEFADALYLTLPFMTEDVYAYSIAESVGLHLVSQNTLTPENSASYGAAFAEEILKHYPVDNEKSRYFLIRAISDGIVKFLLSLVVYANGAPAFEIGEGKLFFASTVVRKPPFEVSVIAPPGTIPSVSDIYGVTAFTNAFLTAVDTSSILRSILYTNKPAFVLAKAWNDATHAFCVTINCHYFNTNVIGTAVALTYDRMDKITYLKCIANGYALTLLGIGVLEADKSQAEASKLATTIENLLNVANVTNFEIKETSIFEALGYLIGSEKNINNIFNTLVDRIEIEFYAVTEVRRPTFVLN